MSSIMNAKVKVESVPFDYDNWVRRRFIDPVKDVVTFKLDDRFWKPWKMRRAVLGARKSKGFRRHVRRAKAKGRK